MKWNMCSDVTQKRSDFEVIIIVNRFLQIIMHEDHNLQDYFEAKQTNFNIIVHICMYIADINFLPLGKLVFKAILFFFI